MPLPLTSTHWGTYRVEATDGRVTALHPFELDPDPSPIGHGIVDVLDGPTRIAAPMVRRSWLEQGPGAHTERRGADAFVEVDWPTVERLLADELRRVSAEHGNESIYAGSYGWANAGRFHHAQSQLKRFLNCIGGFTTSVNTYSFASGEVITPHVLGSDLRSFTYGAPTWPSITEHAELIVAFGGVPLKNGQISQGGGGRHVQRQGVEAALRAGIEFVNISPLRDDVLDEADAQWLALRPSTDAALMLALSHTLVAENLVDRSFVDRYCVGFDQYRRYLMGDADGLERSAEWAAPIVGVSATEIRSLARRMATSKTLVSMSWSLTRQHHGDLTWWAGIALAALVGQIGLEGRGIAFGLSAVNTVGHRRTSIPAVALPQGEYPIPSFVPVARVSDLLLHAGETFTYNGERHTYPDTRLVWWAGGNPFHHHQDLGRLVTALRKPDTIVVNDWCWTAMARHADIVLPCTTTLERDDIAITPSDGLVAVMEQVIEPVGSARNDHQIFRGLARELGVEAEFTEGRSEAEWIEHLYDLTRQAAERKGIALPSYAELKQDQWFEAPPPTEDHSVLMSFRADPDATPLRTPSGRIELFSETIAGFGIEGWPGHPVWIEPDEWLGVAKRHPLAAISNQPVHKLHSQLDHGSVSRAAKVDGREPVTMHPDDAAARGIAAGDVVRVFNDRGACFAAAVVADRVRPGVIQMATGAWYDPETPGDPDSACKHGNPNAFTADRPSSPLSQGCSAHTCMVEVERFVGTPPAVTAFEPPTILRR